MKPKILTDKQIEKMLDFLNYPTPVRDNDFRALCRSHISANKKIRELKKIKEAHAASLK